MTVYSLAELFPHELQARLAACPLLVLPFGTIEWHSFHLPLGLDGIVAQSIGQQIADRCDGVLLEASYWATGGVPYPYTLNLPLDLIESLYQAVFEQFGAMGFRVVVAFSGHFGLNQVLALKRASLEAMLRSPVTLLPVAEYDLVTDLYTGDHAATGETSLMWALRPDLVRLDAVSADATLDGILGSDPRNAASREFGEQLLGHISTRTAEMALRLLNATTLAQRTDYIEALKAGVRVLEKTVEQRRWVPKQAVPPITTPTYLAYCQALFRGDYQSARAHAERKLGNLADIS